MRHFILLSAAVFALSGAPAAAAASPADARIVREATAGTLTATRGRYLEPACNESLDYEAEVVDLNGDGQPEVLTTVHGACLGGMAGAHMNLYILGRDGKWLPQFGFPGVYTVLKSRHKGYPDIEVGGPGQCFPVWRWNGRQYALHKKCPR